MQKLHTQIMDMKEVSDELYKKMCDMSEEKFTESAGDNAWWRSCICSNLGIPDTEFEINGEYLLGWNRWEHERKIYSDLSEYLCDCVGASTGKNVCACCVDLAKYNNMTMAELCEKYQLKFYHI